MLLAIAPADTRASWTSSASSSSPSAPGWGWLTEIEPKCRRPSSSGTRSEDTPRAARSSWPLDDERDLRVGGSAQPLGVLGDAVDDHLELQRAGHVLGGVLEHLLLARAAGLGRGHGRALQHGGRQVGEHPGDIEVALGERLLGVQAGGQDHALLAPVPAR